MESIAAEIWVGGQVSKRLARRLCGVIAREGLKLDWGMEPFEPKEPVELLKALDEYYGVEVLHLCDEQASWGVFDELEDFLRKHGVAYTRRSSATYEYDGSVVMFRPGREPVDFGTNTSGHPLVDFEKASQAYERLKQAQRLCKRGRVPSDDVNAAVRLLKKALPPNVAPLKAFKIEGVAVPVGSNGEADVGPE